MTAVLLILISVIVWDLCFCLGRVKRIESRLDELEKKK